MEPAKTRGRYYRPELDVLRFIAFFSVFTAHAFWDTVPRGYLTGYLGTVVNSLAVTCILGMQIFFFLSAFLIVDLLITEKDRTNSVSVKNFYIRRAFRIWPLYYFGLALGAAFIVVTHVHQWRMLALMAVMLGNWLFATGEPWLVNPVSPLWSVSVEEQFYLFCPWLVRWCQKKTIIGFAAALTALAVGVEAWLGAHHAEGDTVIWANTFVEFEFFAGGMVAAVVLHSRQWRPRPMLRFALAGIAIVTMVTATSRFEVALNHPTTGAFDVVIGFGLALVGVSALFFALLGLTRLPKVLIHFGRISYGLYVFHVFALTAETALARLWLRAGNPFVIMGARYLLALALTVAAAELSYRFFETPFLRLKERFAAVQSRPI